VKRVGLPILALHAAARVAFRAMTPMRATRAINRLAGWLPKLRSVDEARRAAWLLDGRGTCLTRAATIAALTPGSEVVIGVDAKRSTRLRAHAWVVVNGERLEFSAEDAPFMPVASLGRNDVDRKRALKNARLGVFSPGRWRIG
jgi:hypothetical protein